MSISQAIEGRDDKDLMQEFRKGSLQSQIDALKKQQLEQKMSDNNKRIQQLRGEIEMRKNKLQQNPLYMLYEKMQGLR